MIGWENVQGAYYINKLQEEIEVVETASETIDGKIGTLSNLTTSVKTDLVSAINSLVGDSLKVVYLGYVMKDESMTFDVEGDSKFILAMFGTAQGRTGCYMVNVSPSGSSVITNVVAGTDIVITSSTNTLTVTNNTATAERAIHMYALVFNGSIEEHTD